MLSSGRWITCWKASSDRKEGVMPKVNKAQAGEYEAMEAAYHDAINDFNSTLESFNIATQELWEKEVVPKLDTLNTSIAELKTIAEEIQDELQSEFDERSDRWQEGDKGIAFQEWIDRFGEIQDVDEVEMECHQYEEIPEETLEAEVELEYGF
jgi:uncharacterized protein YukE